MREFIREYYRHALSQIRRNQMIDYFFLITKSLLRD